MSSIAGIVRFEGAEVARAEIDLMLDALSHWQTDGRGCWAAGPAGLGHLLLRTTGPSHLDRLPLDDAADAAVITGDVRLDNREELASALSVPAVELAQWPDARLVLRAYRKWGEECPRHLRGDFAFAVWDARRRRIFCARDRFGIKPFFYQAGAHAFVFASEMKGLLALPFVDRRIDDTWIADYLHSVSLDTVSTLYANIRRLEAAHTLTFDSRGVRIRRYWALDPKRELRLARDGDYIDAFREALVRAVRRRAGTPFTAGAELSGGLDSSAVCCIAQGVLGGQGRQLLTFSEVRPEGMPDAPGRAPDWRWAIDSVRKHAGITKSFFLAGDGRLIDALDWAAAHCDEPPRGFTSFHGTALYDMAAAQGTRVLLSGFGGNNCVSAKGYERLGELLRAGQLRELYRELKAPGASLAGRLAMQIQREVHGPLTDAMLRRSATWRLHSYRPTRDEFAARIGMRRRTFAYTRRFSGSGSIRAVAIRLLEAGLVRRLDDAALWTSARRMEYRYPLLDSELVELHLSLPSRLKYSEGVDRRLFRQALEGRVPDDVRLASGPRGAAHPAKVVRNQRDETVLIERLRALPRSHSVFQYVDFRKLFVQPVVPGRQPRHRHNEMVQTLLLALKLEPR